MRNECYFPAKFVVIIIICLKIDALQSHPSIQTPLEIRMKTCIPGGQWIPRDLKNQLL